MATTIRVVETIRVKPSSDSPNSATEFTLPLTFFDTVWFKFHPVERVYFYQLNESSTSTPLYFNSVILPKLKHSLSLTLLHYLPLAGNLRWPSDSPKPIIIYTPNDGVSVTVAESNSNFTLEGLESNSLVPQLEITDDVAPIIALQITLFPSQGFCVGITSHHTILDGKSSTMFMKSWAHLCKHGNDSSLPSELTPFYDRTVIKDPTGLDVLFLNQWFEFINSDPTKRSLMIVQRIGDVPNDLVRATFDISREDIKKLREKVLTKVDNKAKPLHLSSFVLTYAYVSTCLVKVKGGENERTVSLAFAADARSRLDPPVPENYFGNCVSGPFALTKAGKLMNEDGFAFAVEVANDMVKEIETKGIVYGMEGKLKEMFDLLQVPGIQMIGVAGSPRFGVYGTDFGWGKPWKVEVVSIDRGGGAMSLAESRDGSGGVEIGVAMSRPQMESFAALFFDGLN